METKRQTLQVAVVGAGHWGRNIIRELWKFGLLKSVCDPNHETWQIKKYPHVKWMYHYENLLLNADINVIFICTPIAMHYEMARKALNAGKHVFIEKPMSKSIKECRTLLKMSQKLKLGIFIGHILNYHVSIKHLSSWLKKRPEEKIESVYSARGGFNGIQPCDLLWDLAPHDISAVQNLLESPLIIQGVVGLPGNGESKDRELSVVATSISGVNCMFRWTALNPKKIAELTILTSNFLIIFDDSQSQVVNKLRIRDRKTNTEKGETPPEWISPLELELNLALQYFGDITTNIPTTAEEGLSVVKVIQDIETIRNKQN